MNPYQAMIARRWKAAAPYSALFELTYVCNHACSFCYNCPTGEKELGTEQVFEALRKIADFGAVGNEMRVAMVALPVVRRDLLGVGHHFGGCPGGHPLRGPVPGAARPSPLAALTFQAVHVQRAGNARETRREREQGVGGIAEQRDVLAAHQKVERRQEGMKDRIQVLVPDGGQVAQAHA